MITNIQLHAKFSVMIGYSPFKLSILRSAFLFKTVLETAKEKVKYGLQNDGEIAALLEQN